MHDGIAGAVGEAPFLMEHVEIALNVARRQGVRAALVIGGEGADCPEIGPLGGGDEPSYSHILDHALLEWGHGVLLDCVINPHVSPCGLFIDQSRLGTPWRKSG